VGGHFFAGQFACSKAAVTRNLERHGADLERITLTEGFFGDSLTPELKNDWTTFGEREKLGQQKAFDALLARRPDLCAEPIEDFEDHGRGVRIRIAGPLQ